MRNATKITLTKEERQILKNWVRAGTSEQRMVERARMVLEAASGKTNPEIAAKMKTRPSRISKWRIRFYRNRVAGLQDNVRSGKPARYTKQTERRILEVLDEPPPEGYGCWTGTLVAQRLGDVNKHQVWRMLKRHGIHLQRRRSWCVSTDPEFARKAADIVGLYLDPPENALVLCVDEKPAIQALERSQGWLRLPNGKALTGYNHEYARHGTTTLFAALEVASGVVTIAHTHRRKRRDFLAFMNQVVTAYPNRQMHVILDNLKTHKPKCDRWLTRHTNVVFHYTPTHASWLNQIEVWFSILSRFAIKPASFTSYRQLRGAIDRFTAKRNQNPIPFEWTKQIVRPTGLKHKYADLCN